jgi:hypothetical protein
MRHNEDVRAEELHRLKMALAVFALQLDAFEVRARGLLLRAGKSDPSAPLRESGRWSGQDRALEG